MPRAVAVVVLCSVSSKMEPDLIVAATFIRRFSQAGGGGGLDASGSYRLSSDGVTGDSPAKARENRR